MRFKYLVRPDGTLVVLWAHGTMTELFLTKDEIVILTGRKMKRLQIKQLRKMGVPFFVNALNSPVVARSSIEGRPRLTARQNPNGNLGCLFRGDQGSS
jgi:hypothetical protein